MSQQGSAGNNAFLQVFSSFDLNALLPDVHIYHYVVLLVIFSSINKHTINLRHTHLFTQEQKSHI